MVGGSHLKLVLDSPTLLSWSLLSCHGHFTLTLAIITAWTHTCSEFCPGTADWALSFTSPPSSNTIIHQLVARLSRLVPLQFHTADSNRYLQTRGRGREEKKVPEIFSDPKCQGGTLRRAQTLSCFSTHSWSFHLRLNRLTKTTLETDAERFYLEKSLNTFVFPLLLGCMSYLTDWCHKRFHQWRHWNSIFQLSTFNFKSSLSLFYLT